MGWNTRPVYADAAAPALPQLASINDARSAYTTPALPALRRLVMPQRTPQPALGANAVLGQFLLGADFPDPSSAFFRPSGLTAGTLGEQGQVRYIPLTTPDSRIGRFVIGRSPIGWRRSWHKDITPGVVPGDGETEQP